MKKIVSLLMLITLVATLMVSCGNTTNNGDTNNTDANTEKNYSLAIGVVATEDLAKLKVTQTVAAIVTDADGKIVLCRLDCVDYTAKYDDAGALQTTAPTSKVALGENYGTMPAGTWAEQSAALESYVVGKTQAEVAAIALNGGKATDAELSASCTVDITDLLKAIDNAFKSEHKTSFKTSAEALTAGLSCLSTVKDSSTDDSKNVKLSTTYAASVIANGKVVASILDSSEPEFKGITEAGAASLSFKGTKRAQGEAYGVMTAGTWYVQADAYAIAANGLEVSNIASLASEGVAGCTIYSGDLKAAIEAAVKSAR